jgi:hypothetical protein
MRSGAIEEAMSQNFSLNVNGRVHNVDDDLEMPLLKADSVGDADDD